MDKGWDKEWVEKTIREKRRWVTLSLVEGTQDLNYSEAAEIIAAQHEQEVAILVAQVAMMRVRVLETIQLAICWPCEEAASCRYDRSGVLLPVPEWQIDSAPSLELCKAHPFLQALSAAPDRSGCPEQPEENEQEATDG